MGAQYLHSALQGKVLYSEVLSSSLLRVTIPQRTFVVFTPYDGYNGTADMVDTAREKKAHVVVCDQWIQITQVARDYGKKHGIPVYSVGHFLKMLEGGRSPF